MTLYIKNIIKGKDLRIKNVKIYVMFYGEIE